MDTNHVAIAQAEANKAHAKAATDPAAYDAYRRVYEATLARLARAEALLAAGAVSGNGVDGQYYVESQGGNGRYLIRVERAGGALCNCPDFRRRGYRCKHILAAELHEERRGEPGPRPVLFGGRKMYHACGRAVWAEEKRGDGRGIVYRDVYAPGFIERCPACGALLALDDLREHLAEV